ncbi:hypothetical protein C5167_003552 [Papaver somniferum]|uniref:Piwi domain-containing protein n=1 Tax=Papaver somniferum TaxID=3469 RepID=A0A4Y7L4Q7_PAPSO|nr:hypothetical protein C5167_003552 [Papaver somniferum]
MDWYIKQNIGKTRDLVGNMFYSEGGTPCPNGLIFRKSHFQSIRATQMGLSMNSDVSGSFFYPTIKVSEFVFKFFMNESLTTLNITKIEEVFKDVKVVFQFGTGKRYRILSVTETSPPHTCVHGVSVADYFKSKFNIDLDYPNLPCLLFGDRKHPTYVPMELCVFSTNQRCLAADFKILKQYLPRTPKTRLKAIRELVDSEDFQNTSNPFGIYTSSHLVRVKARVIPPPPLKYAGAEVVTPYKNGKWSVNFNTKMLKSLIVDCWAIANFSDVKLRDVERFIPKLADFCESLGMNFAKVPIMKKTCLAPEGIATTLRNISSSAEKNNEKLKLILVILPDKPGAYGEVKRVCEIELGIVSQCLRPDNLLSNKFEIVQHLALKINAKLGGTNHTLSDFPSSWGMDVPTIIFGADVSHPLGKSTSYPSIAAVVGSLDWPCVSQYGSLVVSQESRKEIITDLQEMVVQHLHVFYESCGQWPMKILFYRDGIGESQFAQVLADEVVAIEKACFAIKEGYRPAITFIIIQKRHHTRLFPCGANDLRNISPGTVVDSDICHPTEFDFYLCSHFGDVGVDRFIIMC